MTHPKGYLVAIVIAMFNEEVEARRCIDTVMYYIKNLSEIKLIIVNDGSTDKTATEIDLALKKYNNAFNLINHKKNQGYGAALRTGISVASKLNSEYILFMDADLTNHPRYIKDFIATIPYDYDCVKASRYMRFGKVVDVPLYRRVISYCGNLIAHLCFWLPVHDYTNGFRMVKTSKLAKIPYTSNDFSLIMEEMYWLKKMKSTFYEIPYTLTCRKESASHFSYKPGLIKNYLLFSLQGLFVSR